MSEALQVVLLGFVLIPFTCTIIYIILPLFGFGFWSLFHGILLIAEVFMLLWSYYKASFTSPGTPPKDWVRFLSGNLQLNDKIFEFERMDFIFNRNPQNQQYILYLTTALMKKFMSLIFVSSVINSSPQELIIVNTVKSTILLISLSIEFLSKLLVFIHLVTNVEIQSSGVY
jgi:hypothetical protein